MISDEDESGSDNEIKHKDLSRRVSFNPEGEEADAIQNFPNVMTSSKDAEKIETEIPLKNGKKLKSKKVGYVYFREIK